MLADELCSDDFQDLGEVLVVKHAVNILPALLAKLLIGPQLLGLLVFDLQFV